jgi:hypothetical protein
MKMCKYVWKTRSKWADDPMQEAVRAIKEKSVSIRQVVEAFGVPVSWLQRRFRDIRRNKCLEKQGQTVFSCD